MNAAQRLVLSFGDINPMRDNYCLIHIAGTPPKRRWGKARLPYRAINITPERQLKYMHAHKRRAMERAHEQA